MRSHYLLGTLLGLLLLLVVPVTESVAYERRLLVLEVRSHEKGFEAPITVASLVPGAEDGIAVRHAETPFELHVGVGALYAMVASQGPAVEAVLFEKRLEGPKVLAHGSGVALLVAVGADTPKPMILSYAGPIERFDHPLKPRRFPHNSTPAP